MKEKAIWQFEIFELAEWPNICEPRKKVGNYPYYMFYHNEANKSYHPVWLKIISNIQAKL